MYNTPASVQIQNFMRAIRRYSKRRQPKAGTWYDAFNALEDYLETLPSDRKKVIFIDEMPWMDTQRSNFVNALFSNADTYISIVKLLSENKSGLPVRLYV